MSPTSEVVFVPADPPRAGVLAQYRGPGAPCESNRHSDPGGSSEHSDPGKPASGAPFGRAGELEVVVPAGSRVRRTTVPARLLTVEEALALLMASSPAPSRSHQAWSAAALAGIGLIARGRLLPDRSAAGHGAWRIGPLAPADQAWLRELAAAMPPEAHALPLDHTRPLRIRSPYALIRAFWDAIADTVVRTPAATIAVGATPFAAQQPVTLPGTTDWLTEAARAEEAGAKVVLRIEPPDDELDDELDDEPDDNPDDGADRAPTFRAALQLRSTADPSLIVDVAELWSAPAAVLSRLGDRAEADLLVGLRRGARVWPPLSGALRATTPTGLDLADADLEDLLTTGADALDGAGVEVLWPKELFAAELSVRAGVSTSAPAGGIDGMLGLSSMLEFRWQPTLDGEALTADEVQALADAKRAFIRLRGRWVKIDREALARLRRRGRRRLTATEALAAALAGTVDIDGEVVEFDASGRLGDLAGLLASAGRAEQELDQPAELRATLRPYQRRGLAWLAQLTGLGLGACLADDMGLGKTLQLISLHLHRRDLRAGPTLVVCPTTLLGTWQRELERFAPEVPVRRYHGGSRSLDALAPDEVVLSSYGVVRRDHARLGEIDWGLMVADEAQHAKNPLSRTARAIRSVPATARVALTGTPVENKLADLWSILDWTTPGLLGSLDRFRTRLAVPVERYRDPDATARLAAITRPFLLRRKKSDPEIAPELPPKTESDVIVPLTTEQATLYRAVVDETMGEIAAAEGIARQGLVLRLLTTLKQVCNHPAQYLHERAPIAGRSGKLAALDELLDVILAEGESVLVFSQYVEMNRILEAHLAERGVPTRFLHGGTSVKRREQLVSEFQAGEFPVFLLSLKAAGVGLTLTRATHVVHYDRWWNPAVEDQATDRAYRIGQDRPVQVHRLVTEGTLEDRIGALIAAKRELAEAVVESGEGWIGELSDADLADLVALGGER